MTDFEFPEQDVPIYLPGETVQECDCCGEVDVLHMHPYYGERVCQTCYYELDQAQRDDENRPRQETPWEGIGGSVNEEDVT